MTRITLKRKEGARMRKLVLGLSLALALVGTVRLVDPTQLCNGPGCVSRSGQQVKDDSVKTDLAKGDEGKDGLAKGDDAKTDLGGRL